MNNEDAVDQDSGGGNMAQVTVNHFSDLIPVVTNKKARDCTQGYLILPRISILPRNLMAVSPLT